MKNLFLLLASGLAQMLDNRQNSSESKQKTSTDKTLDEEDAPSEGNGSDVDMAAGNGQTARPSENQSADADTAGTGLPREQNRQADADAVDTVQAGMQLRVKPQMRRSIVSKMPSFGRNVPPQRRRHRMSPGPGAVFPFSLSGQRCLMTRSTN